MQELFSSPVQEINERHATMNRLTKDALANAIRIGELLTQQRNECKYGEWMPWLKANVQFADRTAEKYMRLYKHKDKFEGCSNLTEAYQLTIPKSDRFVAPEGEPEHSIEAKELKPHPQRDEIVGLHNLGKNQTEIAEEIGTSHDAVWRVIEKERIKAAYEPEIILSLTAQQKLERAIEKEKGRLAAQFHVEVNARVKQFLADTIGPQLAKEQKQAKWIMQSRNGVMTRKEFNFIRACLHTDRVATDEEKNKAFALFSSYEKFLLKEKESPTRFVTIPSTLDEWDALRKAVSEARRRKSKIKESSIQKK